jgi:hypothetical protein
MRNLICIRINKKSLVNKKMKNKLGLKKLNQKGFDHAIAIICFVLIFGIIGVFFLIKDYADTSGYAFKLDYGGQKLCLDDYGDSKSANSSITVYTCRSNDTAVIWSKNSVASNEFYLKSANGGNVCVEQADPGIGTSAATRKYVRTATCNSGSSAQLWRWNLSTPSELVNVGSGGCLNDTGNGGSGTQLIIYKCNGGSNERWYQVAESVSSGGTNGGGSSGSSVDAEFLARAEKWAGEPYLEVSSAGSHSYGAYTAYKDRCESKGSPIISSSCAMDCSGFVSVVVDDVLGTNYGWIAANGYLSGTDSGDWVKVSISDAKPGDIAVGDEHVEFVKSGTGQGMVTYGEHDSGSKVSNGGDYGIVQVYQWK